MDMNGSQPSKVDEIWICRRNIERFLKNLAESHDEDERMILLELLEKEEDRLKELQSRPENLRN